MSSSLDPFARFRRLPRPIRRFPAAGARRRLQTWILLSSAVGAVTGLVLAGLHALLIDWTWGPLSRRDDWWLILLPAAGLVLAAALLQLTPDRSTETTEDYVRVFHDPRGRMRLRSAPFRLFASAATISLGGSMGLEGPSIYTGSVIGDAVERRFPSRFEGDEKILLVAGAAAGVAAIFKAPVTGLIFALEVPYRDDLARHALIPAMFSAATGYVVFVAIVGTSPLFPVAAAPLRMADLGGALLVGLGCGLAARVFVHFHRAMVHLARRLTFAARTLVAGAALAAMGAASLAAFHLPLALGPGYEGITRAAGGQIGVALLLALLGMKMAATTATAVGNGVGGLFFPAVLMGATVGGAIGHALPGPPSLFAVVGIAAFLGGAYKVPLAGVAFVAEATGAPGYVIPGLLAAAVAYLASGRGSLSHRQRFRRRVDLDTRLDVPVGDAMAREWTEVPPDATLHELATRYAIAARARTLPVAESGRYLGMVGLSSLGEVAPERWESMTVRGLMNADHPTVGPTWRLRDALGLMRRDGLERVPVEQDGRLVGMISISDVLQLEQILDVVTEQQRRGLET